MLRLAGDDWSVGYDDYMCRRGGLGKPKLTIMGGAMSLNTKPECDCVSVLSSLSELDSFLRYKKKKKHTEICFVERSFFLPVLTLLGFKAELNWKALVECLNH